MVEIEQSDGPPLFGDRHIDHRLGADRLKRLRTGFAPWILCGVVENDGLNVGAIIAKMKRASEALDARSVPVPLDRNCLAINVDLAVSHAADL